MLHCKNKAWATTTTAENPFSPPLRNVSIKAKSHFTTSGSSGNTTRPRPETFFLLSLAWLWGENVCCVYEKHFFKAHFCLSMPWRYWVKNDRRPEIGLAKLPTAMFATTKYTCFGGRFLQHSNSILALYNYTLLLNEEKLVPFLPWIFPFFRSG